MASSISTNIKTHLTFKLSERIVVLNKKRGTTMLHDHTTAQAMTTRYQSTRPRRRTDKTVRPLGRTPGKRFGPRPTIRPVESA